MLAAPARAVRVACSRRWWQVFAVAMLINTSYGTLSYAFSVLITDSGPGGEFGAGTVSLGFGIAVLVSGVAGIFAGAVADLLGTRRLLAAGSLLGCVGLAMAATYVQPQTTSAIYGSPNLTVRLPPLQTNSPNQKLTRRKRK